MFFIRVFYLLLGSASKSIFLQYVHCAVKGNFIDFEIEKIVFCIGVFYLLLVSGSKSIFLQYFNCAIYIYKEN